jgi:hypothetical protein
MPRKQMTHPRRTHALLLVPFLAIDERDTNEKEREREREGERKKEKIKVRRRDFSLSPRRNRRGKNELLFTPLLIGE